MMKYLKTYAFAIAALSAMSSAGATTQTGVTVAGVGTHSGYVFVKLGSPLSDSCNYGTLYAPLSSGFAEYVMSIALTAKATGLPLAQIDYTKSASGQCTIDLIIL
jgi:hypothetical protein